MSEYTEISRAAFEAITDADLDAFLALTAEDVEFDSLVEGRSYKGHDGVREWWENVIESLGGVGLDLEEVSDFDDRGFVKMTVEADEGDVKLPGAIWQAARVEDGKAVWWGVFASEKETRKALGVGKKN
jgi:ketosteroid isomerase-like protein